MKSACFFSTYFSGHDFPYYIRIYLTELSRHFGKIYILTNKKTLNKEAESFIKDINAEIRFYDNEGYDFGMWHKALAEFTTEDFDRIGLVNDSCILFRSLDDSFRKINSDNRDFYGLIASNQGKWHLQSYFLIFNKNAIKHVMKYFSDHGIKSDIENVIVDYEIGLSSYLQNNNLNACSIFTSPVTASRFNPSYEGISDLIKNNFPMIKKKLIFGNYRPEEIPGLLRANFNFNSDYYINLINKVVPQPLIDFNHLKMDYFTAGHVIKTSALQFVSQVLLWPLKLFKRRS